MQMMNRNNNNNIINKNCYMMDYNPYSVNNHHYASTKFWTWQRRREIDGRKWRNENERYGNVMASGGDRTRFGKIRKNTQFRNRNVKNVNRCNNGGGDRFQPYVTERKERVVATPAKADVAAADEGNLLDTSVAWGEVQKEWGLDVYGTMSGMIRLRSDGGDDGGANSSYSDEDFETRLSKYEIMLPKSVNGAGADLKSGGEERSLQLENENVMMKQSLCVMDRDMDDLKRRMEVVEMQFRAKVKKEVKDNGDSYDSMLMKDSGMVSICA